MKHQLSISPWPPKTDLQICCCFAQLALLLASLLGEGTATRTIFPAWEKLDEKWKGVEKSPKTQFNIIFINMQKDQFKISKHPKSPKISQTLHESPLHLHPKFFNDPLRYSALENDSILFSGFFDFGSSAKTHPLLSCQVEQREPFCYLSVY